MKSVRRFFFAGLLVATMIPTTYAQWKQTGGPPGGAVICFAVSGTNLIAGTGSGVFLSTNNGTNWTASNAGLANPYVRSLVASGEYLFAGIGDDGVFRSTDNGTSWTAVNSGLTYRIVSALAVCGTNLLAGTDLGVFVSTNNGTSWAVTELTNMSVSSFAVSGAYLFAGAGGGVFVSTDNGTR